MTTMLAPPPVPAGWSLPVGWETWSDHEKRTLWKQLRAQNYQQKISKGYATPSALARALFDNYVHSPHLDLIDEAYLDADQGKSERIMVCLPPQTGKSTTAAEAGPLWWLQRHPDARVTVASYALKLARRRGKKVRDTIVKAGDQLGLKIEAGSNAKDEFDLITGGGMLCMGVEGGLTGFGSDLMIADDLHKNRSEANSKTMRDAVWGFWQSTVDTRMSPGAPVILIMTRWHEDDVAARVLKNEGRIEDGGAWRVISVPAIAEGRTPKGDLVIDPLGRAPGEPLTHPKLPGADKATLLAFWEQRRRRTGAREWPALFQQRPAPPEGAIFHYDWIEGGRREPQDVPTPVRRVVGVDPSGTDKQTSDECGIVVVGRDQVGDGWVFDDRSKIATPAEWGRTVCLAALDWECQVIVAEQNQGYEMVQDVIKNAWIALQKVDARAAELVQPRVEKAHSRIGKVLRAEPIAGIYEDGFRVHHVGDRLDLLEDQMTTWTGEGDSPDRLDALVHGLTYLLKQPVGNSRSTTVADMSL